MLNSVNVFIHIVSVVNDKIFAEIEGVLQMLFVESGLRRL